MADARNKRKATKAALTRFENYFQAVKSNRNLSQTDLVELKMRAQKADQLLDDFNAAQLKIAATETDIDFDEHDSESEQFENKFYRITSEASKFLIDQMQPQVLTPNVETNLASNSNDDLANIRLPPINLPTFDGSYDQWLFFRDTFNSLIHSNFKLTPAKKFHYLRLSLKGVAAETISSLEISDANYDVAWNILNERFENKQILVSNHVTAIFNLPSLSRESGRGLRVILDGLQKHMGALTVLKMPTEHWDALICHIVTGKFDNVTRRAWDSKTFIEELPTYKELIDFLKDRCRILESFENSSLRNASNKIERPRQSHPNFHKNTSQSFVATNSNKKCTFCQKEHLIYTCPQFLQISAIEKLNNAKQMKLCINCLSIGHATKNCRSSGCRKCGKFHHTLLHFNKTDSGTVQTNNNNTSTSSYSNSTETDLKDVATTSLSTHVMHTPLIYSPCSLVVNEKLNLNTVLLSTAIIKVSDTTDKSHLCRVLLDSGSQSNFISERLCNLLQLPIENIKHSITGISQKIETINSRVFAKVQSNFSNFEANISCLVLKSITGNIPAISFDSSLLHIPKNIALADPDFSSAKPIDLLLGADIFWELIHIGQIKLGRGLPILQKTHFGWIISGPLQTNLSSSLCSKTQCFFTTSIDNQLTKFWEVEEFPKTKYLSPEETFCEEHFSQHTSRAPDGKFVVHLPLKDSIDRLGDSKLTATSRFLNLEGKLNKSPDLKRTYQDFITEYEKLGHMTLSKNQNDTSGYFLPHHCVLKLSSTTTKLRVVFDASCKSDSGFSLNDLLMVGPNVQNSLFSILLRYRIHPVVLSGDIEKMYRQVYVAPEYRKLQRILWRANINEPILTYDLSTVTYGTASAAFLATRSLQEVGKIHAKDCPKISNIIQRDFYVDDLLTGAQTVDELRQIKEDIHDLLMKYGFPLRKWASNEPTLTSDSSIHSISFDTDIASKTLGLLWNHISDTLEYKIGPIESSTRVTKRTILSSISQIFDPLGLLSPVTISAKIILQQLWKLKISWDESIPMDLFTIWSSYRTQLVELNNLKIPRLTLCGNPIELQLHGFSDAAEPGYGACVYLCSKDSLGNSSSKLLCAKTRVSPLKELTIPRLELCAALLLAELAKTVLASIPSTLDSKHYWCDSTIVLAWIRSSPHRLKTFIANRIAQIQSITNIDEWRYIRTADNPADLLTRGIPPLSLLNSTLWFHGPPWLTEDEWPTDIVDLSNIDTPELRNVTSFHVSIEKHTNNDLLTLIDKFSNLTKLVRTFAFVLRFKNILKLKSKSDFFNRELSTLEIENSLHTLVSLVQASTFSEEFKALKNNNKVSNKSKLLTLNPFFDHTLNLIRVGGRLQQSDYEYQKKHPIVLPPKHRLSLLIAHSEHIKLLHAGPQLTLASLRESFWPINGRNLIKKVYHDCLTCFRFVAKSTKYLMGNLPKTRITPSRPFSVSGVDYAGPFSLRDRKGRNFRTNKAYIALFVCFATKAIHLELVSDLTSECFLAALYRFMSRRGKCIQIYSDQGTTFVGALNELNSFLKGHSSTISDKLANQGIQWNFIPPRAPHFGGLWESSVKSVKFHLKRVVGSLSLTFEDFSTIITQIEACLNSRPLCPLSDNPNDPNPLTPAHFLIGEPLTTCPQVDLLGVAENRLSKYQHRQQMVQHFWSRWVKECIAELQIRTKWKQNYPQLLKLGVLVLIMEDGLPPLKWRTGRVVQIFPGGDGIVRTVLVRTAAGEYKRPVTKIAVLPIYDF
ncbi:uncharacterized protein LOC126749716 [Anthonomus grandis grandis]|uniref:uncharacterized protein LOC126749716 n=1 Tax=Anthonomus grandis grandis TaxID=2921223 RepID=UPI0021660F55|nr:uncharacterized protein LOC126749716 [Anthonomus grandis grandis]